MPKPIDERIAAALAPGARAATVAELVQEVAGLIETAKSDRAEAERKSTSFDTPEAEAEAAADSVVKIDRRITRLTAAQAQLEARHTELMASERRKRLVAEHAEIKARRDALVADLQARWPQIECEIVQLLHRIEASDAEIAAFQQGGVPAGLEWLGSAEALARDVPGVWAWPAGGPIQRLTKIKLPAFDGKGTAWPDMRPEIERATALQEQQRQQLLQAKRHKEAAAARFKMYEISPPAHSRDRRVDSALGRVEIVRSGWIRMDDAQVEAARARGFTVKPLAPGKTIGGPSGVTTF